MAPSSYAQIVDPLIVGARSRTVNLRSYKNESDELDHAH
jgi:hypothetical protein